METGQAREVFTDFRVELVEKDNLRANVACKVSGAIWLTGIRVVQGAKGLFIAMPCKQNRRREYMDIFFPASREIREQLQAAALVAYHKAIQLEQANGAPVSLYSPKSMAALVG